VGHPDDVLLAQLQAAPDLNDGIESLRYWRDRAQRLPWYKINARREAKLMTRRWEQRVRAALFSQRGVAFRSRLSAGLLLGQLGLQRVHLRTILLTAGAIATAVVALPLVLAVLVLTQVF
jgi:hypothetical protein